MKSFDLIVIGSGAGLIVAIKAADAGLKVALVESGPLGGTCLNRGCIPSKIVIHSADIAETIKRSNIYGIESSLKNINLKTVTARASKIVDDNAKYIERNILSGRNPVFFKGKGTFVDKYVIQVNKERITGKKILIATGARPIIPPIDGIKETPFITSTEALRQTNLPKSMIIIGGGYISAELGYFYAAMGCKITIIQRAPLLLPREDHEVASLFTRIWKNKYTVITSATVTKVEKKQQGILAIVKIGNKTKKFSAEKLLVAAGVQPNSDSLNLKEVNVKVDQRGFIKVNRFMETNTKNILAIGDVAGIFMYRHSANLEANYVINNILRKKKAVDYYPMPHAVFTNPQIAGVGLTEQEAAAQKKNYVVGKSFYKDTGMGAALAEKEGFMKLIVEKKTKKILGCHILGPHASILLHEVCVAMKSKNGLDLLKNTIHVHPALSELVQKTALNVPL